MVKLVALLDKTRQDTWSNTLFIVVSPNYGKIPNKD
jgi:hypothetical protein